MTHDSRHDDPNDPGHDHDHADETRVVERQTYVERERPVATGYVPPAQPVGGQVNVSSAPATPAYAEPARGPMYWARRVLTLLFSILTVLLAIRVILFLLVANQSNQIVDFVYGVTEPFVAPFRGIFAFDNVQPGGGSVFDIAAVVAFIGWLLIYLLLMAILSLADRDATRAA
ncbi:MAG: YggT family protein [Candidatus Limnocylindria bacterium]